MIHNINRKKDRNHITSIAEKDKLKKKINVFNQHRKINLKSSTFQALP